MLQQELLWLLHEYCIYHLHKSIHPLGRKGSKKLMRPYIYPHHMVKSLLFVVRLECCSKSCSGCCMIWAIWTSIRWHWVIYFYLKNILKHLYLRSGRSASIFRKSKNPQICGLKKICYIFLRTFRKCGNLRICGPICFCGFKTSANS